MRASGRMMVIGVAVFIVVVIVFGRALARFYVDMLWYDGLGQSGVFWTALRARLLLFMMFFALFAVLSSANLAIADKLAPSRFPVNAHPLVQRFHETFGRRLRFYRYVAAGVFAFLLALPTSTQWQSWLLFRHSQSFGVADPQFGADIGFYVFELPFLSFVLDWLFFAMVLVLLLVVVTHVLNGGVMFASPIPTLSQGARGHIAVVLAVLATLKAADYWIRRYETTNERRGFVQGATYSVVNALHPALLLLAFVAVVTAGLYLATLKTQSWRLPLVASAVWAILAIVAGYIYPAAVQGLIVNANQRAREAEYIERNVIATRSAMGLTDVDVRDVEFGALTAAEVAADVAPLENVRLLNPDEMLARFTNDVEEAQAGLQIDDLDVDRYRGEHGDEQVLIAARELDLDSAGNRSWQGRHLINTRGCGLVTAPASRVRENGQPDYHEVELERPELYFSPTLEGYAIVGTEETERSCGGADDVAYGGDHGVRMSSFLRRAAFGLAFLDYNIVGSGAIDGDSQMLWVRNIHDRLEKLAPFLSYDGDPYPAVVGGRVVWLIDAYTSTSRYPYAEAVGEDVRLTQETGIPRDANYVRNSVKAVVDAYDGSVTLYVMDDDEDGPEPIVRAWMAAFPDLFEPASAMSAELRQHLRYPEDLFRVQTNVYSKYQERYESEPEAFFEREGAWSVAQAPADSPREPAATSADPVAPSEAGEPDELAEESSNQRFVPYYTMFAGEGGREFVLLRPFVPFTTNDARTELTAYMTASSDPEHYGTLTVYVVADDLPRGPFSVANAIETEPEVSRAITDQVAAGNNSTVHWGDLQLVPIGDGLVYVRPFYVARGQSGAQNAGPRYEYITVWYDEGVAIAQDLGEALGDLFPGLELDVGERADEPQPPQVEVTDAPTTVVPDAPGDGDPSPDGPISIEGSPEELLAEAARLLDDADAELREGDLGAYQDLVDEAGELVERALAQLDEEAGASTVPAETDDAGSAEPTPATTDADSPASTSEAPPATDASN
jgi:uncharacterized membrane protein (UPF0182 family)